MHRLSFPILSRRDAKAFFEQADVIGWLGKSRLHTRGKHASSFFQKQALSSGCADLYNPKTVRATMGAAFRMHVQMADRASVIRACRNAGIPILSTALSNRAQDLREASLSGAVVIGSEGRGVSEEYLAASAREIIIPMNPRCESLNAATAAAVVMWEMKCRK